MTEAPEDQPIYTGQDADKDAIYSFVDQVIDIINAQNVPQRIYAPALFILAAAAVGDSLSTDAEIMQEFSKCLLDARTQEKTMQ